MKFFVLCLVATVPFVLASGGGGGGYGGGGGGMGGGVFYSFTSFLTYQ